MNILYLGLFRFPEGDAAASRVLNNARLFRDLGHSVKILSFGGEYREQDISLDGYVYDGLHYVITHDIDTHSWKERFLRYIYPNPNARNYIAANIDSFDIVVSYNTTLPMNIYLQHICKKHGKKIILDVTEWPDSNELLGGKLSPIYWMSELNMRFIQKHFKNMIPISQFLNRFYSHSNNILLPPLIDINDTKWNCFKPVDFTSVNHYNGVRIIFAGTPARKDLLKNLVEAIVQVLNEGQVIQLVVAGVSIEQANQFCAEDILSKYRNDIVFLGRIPQSLVPSLYHISTFSAIIREPSRKNTAGFPTKMVESMAAGCPVLLNITSDLGDYAIDGENAVLIENYHVCSIKEGLMSILSMTNEKISKMKLCARKTGEQRFDYHNYMEMGLRFINNLK
ncbi:MAG: glycosyltransferase [Bacteroidales bacterium]|nr:glycosyltransferase [Bacteroidales bacterium]